MLLDFGRKHANWHKKRPNCLKTFTSSKNKLCIDHGEESTSISQESVYDYHDVQFTILITHRS